MKIIHYGNEIINVVNDFFLQNNEPFFISRIGGSDFELVCDYFNDKNVLFDSNWSKKSVDQVKELNGYFDFTDNIENFKKYLETLMACYESSDLIMYAGKQEKYFRFFLNGKSPNLGPRFDPYVKFISQEKTLINYNQFIYEVKPFLESFQTWGKDKTILIVSPFSESIEHQYYFKDHLFLDYKFPNFSLKTCTTKITYNNIHDTKQSLGIITNDWHEECERLAGEISKINFDIALLSCGSYSMYLGNFIKTELKKRSLYLGGAVNLIFGIYGNKFEEMFKAIGTNQEFILDPIENKDIENISGGRAYPNESLMAYFGKK